MLSYRHAYHAGNFADVLKHTTIITILRHLCEKPGPIHYIDTHAGAGKYRLDSDMALKTTEFEHGIARLWQATDLPAELQDYVSQVKSINHGKLLFYPGSPLFAAHCLRKQDKLHLCELHTTDYPLLRQTFAQDRRTTCYPEDGYQRSLALVPPISKRGLIVIDPSYEVKSEYHQVTTHLKALHKKFSTGVFALWYPIIDSSRRDELKRVLRNAGIKRIHLFELGLTHDHSVPGMSGSGMIIINPPWQLRERLELNLAWLTEHCFTDTPSYWHSEELVGE